MKTKHKQSLPAGALGATTSPAHDEPATHAEAHAAGCAAYFSKTDSGEAVLAAIRRAAAPEPAHC